MPSSRCQSSSDSLRAIGNPKMYKPTQQFFFFSLTPGWRVRNKEDRRGTNHRRRQKFLHPRSSRRSPFPIGLILHIMWHFSSLSMIASHWSGRPRTRTKNLRPEGDTGLGGGTTIRRPIDIFLNCLISIVRPHSVSRSVPNEQTHY